MVTDLMRSVLMPGGCVLLSRDLLEAVELARVEASGELEDQLTLAANSLPRIVGIVQPIVIDLIAQGRLPREFTATDVSPSAGLAALAVLDVLSVYHRVVDLLGLDHSFRPRATVRVSPPSPVYALAFRAIADRLDVEETNVEAAHIDLSGVPAGGVDLMLGVGLLFRTDGPKEDVPRVGLCMEALADHGVLVLAERGTPERARRVHSIQRAVATDGGRVLGPCAAIRGLPAFSACETCAVARRVHVATPGVSDPPEEFDVAYTMLQRPSAGPADEPVPGDSPRRVQLFAMKHEAKGKRTITACDQERGPSMLSVAVPAGVAMREPQFGEVVELEGESSNIAAALETVTLTARTRVRSLSDPEPIRQAIFDQLAQADEHKWTLAYFARRLFGFAELHPSQAEIIARVLRGEDTLGVLATGAGKSLTFQLSAFLLPGVTVVVSPLRALMADQVANLNAFGLHAAEYVDSRLSPKERLEVNQRLLAGRIKLLYVSPERLQQYGFRRLLSRVNATHGLSLLVIDEAHCLSQWGHDFRPPYLSLDERRRELGGPPVLALTATASKRVRDDIMEHLAIDPNGLVQGRVDRPEISYEVRASSSEGDGYKAAVVAADVAQAKGGIDLGPGCGLIFTPYASDDRELGVDSVAEIIADALGEPVFQYHAKLPEPDKAKTHRDFKRAEYAVLVGTNAFGMGIDKPNIRWVAHTAMPASIEAYYQEAGRAGRDHKHSHAVLIHVPRREGCDVRRSTDVPAVSTLEKPYACGARKTCPVDGLGKCDYGRDLFFVESGYPTAQEMAVLSQWLVEGGSERTVFLSYFGLADKSVSESAPFVSGMDSLNWYKGKTSGVIRAVQDRVTAALDALRRLGFVSDYSPWVPATLTLKQQFTFADLASRTNDLELTALLERVRDHMGESFGQHILPGTIALAEAAAGIGLGHEEAAALFEGLSALHLVRLARPFGPRPSAFLSGSPRG